MEREKSIFTFYTCCMYVLVFQRKPCLRVINKFNCLKDVQNFDTNKSNQKEKKQKKKEKNIQFTTFRTHATMRNILKINECILTNF